MSSDETLAEQFIELMKCKGLTYRCSEMGAFAESNAEKILRALELVGALEDENRQLKLNLQQCWKPVDDELMSALVRIKELEAELGDQKYKYAPEMTDSQLEAVVREAEFYDRPPDFPIDGSYLRVARAVLGKKP